MVLSDRLEKILTFCGSGSCAADVGTDHGMVPIELVSRGLFRRAIAMDIGEGPLSRAREHIRSRGLEDCIGTRLSDGLSRLAPGEADVLVVAGMGGPLMSRILQEGLETARTAERLVLSPQSDIPSFRKALHAMGFTIAEEELLEEEGKEYVILLSIPGEEPPWTEEEYRYGKKLLEKRHPLLLEKLHKEIRFREELIRNLSDSTGERTIRRLEVLKKEKETAERVLRQAFSACPEKGGGMIRLQIGEETVTVPKGTILKELADRFQEKEPAEIVLAVVNGKLKELHKSVKEDAVIRFVTTRETVGMRVYERGVQMMLGKAIHDLYSEPQVTGLMAQFSVTDGIYIEIQGEIQPDQEFLDRVSARMHELVEADLPFEKYTRPLDDAMKLFRTHGMQDKEKLFRYRRSSYVNLYELDGYVDYFYGYMVPSTGYLKEFMLLLYGKGVVLRIPERSSQKMQPFVPQNKLYSLMQESEAWGVDMKMSTVGEINDLIAAGKVEDMVLVAEARQEAQIAAIAAQIAARPDIKFVMIAGPSSSGKTSFSYRLSVQLRAHGLSPHPVAVDDYFVDREHTPRDENGEYDFEALECVDIARFNEDMTALLAGQEVPMPTFDFVEGRRTYKGNTLQITDHDVLVIEGIHCLNDRLSVSLPKESKFRIYISALTQLNIDNHNRIPTTDGRLIRRMIRDARTRGTSAQDTIARWPSVRRGEERNIFPYQESADVMFNSSLVYEFSVMKPYAEQLLYGIPEDVPEYLEAKRLLKFFDYFLTIHADAIPRNSLIKEFIGGSIFKV